MTLCYGAVFVILIIIPKRISSHWVLLSFLFADYAFAKYPVGSPLIQLGSVAVDIPGIASAYSMTGPFWITLWVVLIACVIFNTATQKPVRKHVWAFLASVPLLCLLGGNRTNATKGKVNVAMIPIADIDEKDQVPRYIETAAHDGAEIVVLPEGIYTFIHPQETVSPLMTKLRRDVKAGIYPTILLGVWTLAPGRFENAAVSYSKEGVFRRDKVKRVPFGEYVPLQKHLSSRLHKLIPYPVTLRDNVDGNAFPSGNTRFSPLICYEALFTDLMIEYVREGAEIFMVLSSNSLIKSELIERQIITPYGKINSQTEFRTGLHREESETSRDMTFYVKYSKAIDLFYLLLLILLSVKSLNYKI